MKTLVISYSLTGNNSILAGKLAEKLGADHIEIEEYGKRTVLTTVFDVIFNRTPRIEFNATLAKMQEHLVFVAPVWLGAVASPLRGAFSKMRDGMPGYTFVSFSAGADGPNPDLEKDLRKRTGKKPQSVINPLITDLLPAEPKPTRKELDAYRLKGEIVDEIAENVFRLMDGKG